MLGINTKNELSPKRKQLRSAKLNRKNISINCLENDIRDGPKKNIRATK